MAKNGSELQTSDRPVRGHFLNTTGLTVIVTAGVIIVAILRARCSDTQSHYDRQKIKTGYCPIPAAHKRETSGVSVRGAVAPEARNSVGVPINRDMDTRCDRYGPPFGPPRWDQRVSGLAVMGCRIDWQPQMSKLLFCRSITSLAARRHHATVAS